MTDFIIDVTTSDKKYRYTMTARGTVAVYRNKEPWTRDVQGDGMMMALAADLQEQHTREQLLIDLMFSFAMRINARDRVPGDREELAEWMRRQLKECGFATHKQGMSWAVLE